MSEMVKYYSQIKAAYKNVVPIQAAYNITQPYAETNWTGPTFEQYTGGAVNVTTTSISPSASASGSGSASAKVSGSGTGSNAAAASASKKSGAGLSKEIGGGLGMLVGLMGLWAVL